MKKNPLHLKEIGYEEPIFYWYELGGSTYALYDSDMGEPVSYGSLNLVVGTIRAINEEVLARKRAKCVLYYFKRDKLQGWRKSTPPVLFNWNPDISDKKLAYDKKNEEDTDKKLANK